MNWRSLTQRLNEYYKQRKRIMSYIKRWENKGWTFENLPSFLTDMPSYRERITKAEVEQYQEMTANRLEKFRVFIAKPENEYSVLPGRALSAKEAREIKRFQKQREKVFEKDPTERNKLKWYEANTIQRQVYNIYKNETLYWMYNTLPDLAKALDEWAQRDINSFVEAYYDELLPNMYNISDEEAVVVRIGALAEKYPNSIDIETAMEAADSMLYRSYMDNGLMEAKPEWNMKNRLAMYERNRERFKKEIYPQILERRKKSYEEYKKAHPKKSKGRPRKK